MKKIFVSIALCTIGAAGWSQVLTPEQINQNPEMRKKIYKDTFMDDDDAITSMDSVQFFQQRDYIPYPPIREADVLWSKMMIRDIEVGERLNQPLYYPLDPHFFKERQPLFDIILQAVKDSSVIAFEGKDDAYNGQFVKALPIQDALKDFGYKTYIEIPVDENDPSLGFTRTEKVSEFEPGDVVAYRLKEYWYFDKQRSQMMVKIIGINPIAQYDDPVLKTKVRSNTVWIYFPELRPVIANKEVYNTKNETVRQTFDDLFIQRRFTSHVVKEDNVYNRTLAEAGYQGFDQLVESERIKEELFNFEHDLWDY